MRKKIMGVLLVTTITLGGCALNSGSSSTNSGEANSNMEVDQQVDIILNERQKSILEKEGKPTEYSELDTLSKNVIVNVEECYEYLDETYPDVEFEYVTYYYTSPIHLVVYSKEDSRQRPISVYVENSNGEHIYTDTYMQVMESDVYAEEVKKYVNSIYPDAGVFVETEINDEHYKAGDENIMTRAAGTTSIVISDVFSDGEEVKSLLQKVIDWMSANYDTSEMVYLVVLTKEDFGNATVDNYIKEYIKTGKTVYRIRASKNTDGEVTFFEK